MYKVISKCWWKWLIHVKSDSFTERGLFELILKEKEFSQILGASKFSGKSIFANLENSTWPGVYECILNSHSWSQCFNHTKLKSVYFHQLTTWNAQHITLIFGSHFSAFFPQSTSTEQLWWSHFLGRREKNFWSIYRTKSEDMCAPNFQMRCQKSSVGALKSREAQKVLLHWPHTSEDLQAWSSARAVIFEAQCIRKSH